MEWVKAYEIFQQKETLNGFGNGMLDMTSEMQTAQKDDKLDSS